MNVELLKKSFDNPRIKRNKTIYDKFLAVGEKSASNTALVASASRNCEFSFGRLSCGVGVKKYYLPYAPDVHLNNIPEAYGEALKFFAFSFEKDGVKKESIMVETSLNELFVFDEAKADLKILDSLAIGWQGIECVDENGKKLVYVTTESGTYIYDPIKAKGSWVIQEIKLAAGCFFHQRIFLGGGNTIKYSAPIQITDFVESADDGGSMVLPSELGEIVGMQVLGENIFVFLSFGIVKLNASGAARDFSLEVLECFLDEAVKDSFRRYEDCIYFACEDGIKRFNGRKVEAVATRLRIQPKKGSRRYLTFCDGKLFISYYEQLGELKTVFSDLSDEGNHGECFLANGLSYSQGVAFCSSSRMLGCLEKDGDIPTDDEYSFKTKNLDFGSKGLKWVRSVEVKGVGECDVTLIGDEGEQTKSFRIEEFGKQWVDFSLKGKEFTLIIKLYKGSVIEGLTIETESVIGGGNDD